MVRNGIDHHRSRYILEKSLESLSKELVAPFVKECKIKDVVLTEPGYRTSLDTVKDENYIFLYHVTFSYLSGFHLYTEPVRKNHSLSMIGARIQIAPLFYSFHHPKYKQLHLKDLCQRVQMPDELKLYQMKNETFSVSGVSNCGQGADFIHEEINKLVKSFLPPGMPTTEI